MVLSENWFDMIRLNFVNIFCSTQTGNVKNGNSSSTEQQKKRKMYGGKEIRISK